MIKRLALLSAGALLASCSSDDEATVAAPDTAAIAQDAVSEDTSAAPADAASDEIAMADAVGTDTAGDTSPIDAPDTTPRVEPTGCDADHLGKCLYEPSTKYAFTTKRLDGKVVYKDLLGDDRNVNIAIYLPTDAPMPAPVVVLSHGGADGKDNPLNSMENRAPVFARAGYVTVAIAHEGRAAANYDALCQALHVQTDLQCAIKIHWDRPNDMSQVLDFLESKAKDPDFQGRFDLSRIAHVGHSAGAGAVLMTTGATRNFICGQPVNSPSPLQKCAVEDLVSLADPRIDVGVALSPQGPGGEGFLDESFVGNTKPLMMATGAVDGDGLEPANRLGLWPALPAGHKLKLYLDSQGAKHTLFEGTTEACLKQIPEADCEEMRTWVFSTALAFVDAELVGSARAQAWLASDDIVTAGHGVASVERK